MNTSATVIATGCSPGIPSPAASTMISTAVTAIVIADHLHTRAAPFRFFASGASSGTVTALGGVPAGAFDGVLDYANGSSNNSSAAEYALSLIHI